MNIDDIIKKIPISLNKDDRAVQELALFYLPYSTGFEIECYCKDNADFEMFKNIPDILEADVNTSGEQRFRIPNGIKGLQCLFNVSIALKKEALFNKESGIHYHIDCTDWFDNITSDFLADNSEYILTELDTWQYKGTYNKRKVVNEGGGVWVRSQRWFKTLEFRIGEMAFDYSTLFKRITHCNDIVRTLKNKAVILPLERYTDDVEKAVTNRIIKI